MPRQRNQLKSVQIKISTTGAILELLESLVATGFYGKNHTEAAERLLAQTLEARAKEGNLKPRRSR